MCYKPITDTIAYKSDFDLHWRDQEEAERVRERIYHRVHNNNANNSLYWEHHKKMQESLNKRMDDYNSRMDTFQEYIIAEIETISEDAIRYFEMEMSEVWFKLKEDKKVLDKNIRKLLRFAAVLQGQFVEDLVAFENQIISDIEEISEFLQNLPETPTGSTP